jgi:calcineurin-like phosphoesterase family protein
MVFFTADTHFGSLSHLVCFNRPFKDVRSMDNAIIDRWNSVVSKSDMVYHLGDFGSWVYMDFIWIFYRLNGNKILVVGNHDNKPAILNLPWQQVIPKSTRICVDGKTLFLSHYPRKNNKRKPDVWYLHGHVHGSGKKLLDVGVDCWDFRPISFAEIRDRMSLLQERLLKNSHK